MQDLLTNINCLATLLLNWEVFWDTGTQELGTYSTSTQHACPHPSECLGWEKSLLVQLERKVWKCWSNKERFKKIILVTLSGRYQTDCYCSMLSRNTRAELLITGTVNLSLIPLSLQNLDWNGTERELDDSSSGGVTWGWVWCGLGTCQMEVEPFTMRPTPKSGSVRKGLVCHFTSLYWHQNNDLTWKWWQISLTVAPPFTKLTLPLLMYERKGSWRKTVSSELWTHLSPVMSGKWSEQDESSEWVYRG